MHLHIVLIEMNVGYQLQKNVIQNYIMGMKIQSSSPVHRASINITITQSCCNLLGRGALPTSGISVYSDNDFLHRLYLRFAFPCLGDPGCQDWLLCPF